MSAHAQPSSAPSHTAHHNDPRRSFRDATPPVGAIMDIQMMHASHLFNANGLANGSVAQALAEKWGRQGNIEVQHSEDMDDGDEEPVDYDYEDVEQENHRGDGFKEGHNRTGTSHTYTQPSAKKISHTHARVGDNITPQSEVLSEEGTEDEERLYSSEDEGWEHGSRDEVESIVSEEDGPSDFDDNGGSDVRHSDDEEDDNPTDPKVLEEIRDVQEVFHGIDKHFRLINKIGEGSCQTYIMVHASAETVKELLVRSTKLRICNMTDTLMTGIWTAMHKVE